jgi:hypothetical protein
MPLDDRLRRGLRRIADEVDPDVERGIRMATSARLPSPIRRAGTVLSYVAAAALGVAVIGLGASSLLDRFGAGPSPTASVEASELASACPSSVGDECVGPIEPGSHRSQQFIPPINYVIPTDPGVAWDKPEDLPGTFTLHPAGPKTDAIFFFRDVRVTTPGCDSQFDDTVGNRAAEIAAWIAANPNLTTTTP